MTDYNDHGPAYNSPGYGSLDRELHELRAERDRSMARLSTATANCRYLDEENAALKAELADLRIRVDLDALGGHERGAVELVDRRAEVARLKEELAKEKAQIDGWENTITWTRRQLDKAEAEVARLTEEPTDAEVERVALAIERVEFTSPGAPWPVKISSDLFRQFASAALAAAREKLR